ncbi:MAG: phosphoglycerate kinase [Patescibacteria group bacterium]
MNLRTISEAENLKDRRVLVRVDFNVPIQNSQVTNDTRIRVSVPTIEFLQKAGAKIILLAHLGRPKGAPEDALRLDPVAGKLAEILQTPVKKLDDCIGSEVENAIAEMQSGEIILLENTRFHDGEEKNTPEFVAQLMKLGDIFVDDAFGVAHRAHASNFGLAEKLPSFAGFSLTKEIESLSSVLTNPKKPLVVILGGAKIDTKIGVLRKFVELADTILLGGGLANTFLAAQNFAVGASLCETDKLETAREILAAAEKSGCKIILPSDTLCAPDFESAPQIFPTDKIPDEQKILDLGPDSIQNFSAIIQSAGTVVWNGPVGLFENPKFGTGTKEIIAACEQTSADTILGGGDTLAALAQFDTPLAKFTHVSTGGGAMLEFLEGQKMPALAILEK